MALVIARDPPSWKLGVSAISPLPLVQSNAVTNVVARLAKVNGATTFLLY